MLSSKLDEQLVELCTDAKADWTAIGLAPVHECAMAPHEMHISANACMSSISTHQLQSLPTSELTIYVI